MIIFGVTWSGYCELGTGKGEHYRSMGQRIAQVTEWRKLAAKKVLELVKYQI